MGAAGELLLAELDQHAENSSLTWVPMYSATPAIRSITICAHRNAIFRQPAIGLASILIESDLFDSQFSMGPKTWQIDEVSR